MSTHLYSREFADGHYNVRVLDLAKEAKAALPGNTFSVKAADTVVTIIATPDLTGGEESTLDTVVSDHKAAVVVWPPLSSNGLKVNDQTGTSYTFELEDEWRYSRFANVAAINATIPPYEDVPFPLGTQLPYGQILAGKVTLVEGAGVTIVPSERTTTGANKGAVAIHIALDVWDVHGALEA